MIRNPESIRVNISLSASQVSQELRYVLMLLGINKNIRFDIQESSDLVNSIGTGAQNTYRISQQFAAGNFASEFSKSGFFELENGEPDYFGTAFFCLSCLQEYGEHGKDALGRFQYQHSHQFRNNTITRNIVQECFDGLAARIGISSPVRSSSEFFLSHDIDLVYGAIKEDGFNVIKKGRFDIFFKLLMNVAMGRPDWLNIDDIVKLESEYDCISTFYWIVKKGKEGKGLENADYKFNSSAIQRHVNFIRQHGFENGLHKSLSSSSFDCEIKEFKDKPIGNRYHYLKFNLPAGFDVIEESGMKLDASLGFSEHWGFRNNYGLPYNPYCFKSRRPYTFVEVPLHIMDRTFFQRRMSLADVEKNIFDFFENNRWNCVISVLWHNNFFTEYKYKGYLSLYKKILVYIKENNLSTMSQSALIQKYNMQWQ
jgi:hypothetical protein